MSRFNEVLVGADARLTVPEPARSRILLEIASDMEGLFQEYRARGMEEPDAESAVMDHFDLSEEALTDLVRVHDAPLQRSLEGLSGQVQRPWSRVLMTGLALFVVVGSGMLLVRPQLYRIASPVLWVLLPLLAMGLWVAGGHLLRLRQARQRWTPGLRLGLGRLLALAVTMVGLSLGGLLVELYLSALRIRDVPSETLIHLVGWLHTASATLVVSLSGALVLAFLWFFLESQTRRHERMAAVNLLGGVS